MDRRPAVTFDLWHTLVHLRPAAETEYLHRQFDAATRVLAGSALAPGAVPVGERELRDAFEREVRRAVALSHEGQTVTPAEQLARAANATGRVARPDAYLDELDQLIRETEFIPAPGALEVLGRLRDEGYRVGIISNTVGEPGRYLRGALGGLGFDGLVERYTFSDEEPWAKPSPEIFRAALDRIGSAPDLAVHVGDGWADIEGARRAQLRAAILFTGLHEYAPEYRDLNYAPSFDRDSVPYRTADLREVPPLIERLLPLPRP